MIKNIPLSMKLPVAVFLLTVLMSASIILFSYTSVTSLFEKQEIDNLQTKTALVAAKLIQIDHPIDDDQSHLEASLADGALDLNGYKTAIIDENGDAVLNADFPAATAISNAAFGLSGKTPNAAEVVKLSDGSAYFIATQTVELAGQQITVVVAEGYDSAMQGRNEFVKTLLAIVNFCALGFMLFVTLFTRSSVEPMKRMQQQLNRIALQKDLTIKLPKTHKDEVGKSLASVEVILESFDTFVRDAKLGSDELLTISDQMADTVANLARETEHRATSIEELSQSLAQTEAQTSFTASMAESTEKDMQQAEHAAVDGQAKIGELTKIVEQIAGASADISSVINAIEGIAFQTNLLALNASVEAARAGAHGKGFAVVASEVGQLAQRASSSAQDSAELIEQTLAKIDLSKDASQRANEAFKTISDRVHGATQKVSEISSANREQKSAIETASTNASNLAVSANNDAAQYERLAQASARLQHRSEAVSAQVSQYKYTDKRSGAIHALVDKKMKQKSDLPVSQGFAAEPAKIVSVR